MECPHLVDFDKLLLTTTTTTRNGTKIPPQQIQQQQNQQYTPTRGTRSSKGGQTPQHQCQGKTRVDVYQLQTKQHRFVADYYTN